MVTYPATGDPDPFKPMDMVTYHVREACRWLIASMPEEGVREMTERLAEIAEFHQKREDRGST